MSDVETLAWIPPTIIRLHNPALNGSLNGHRFWKPGLAPAGHAYVGRGA